MENNTESRMRPPSTHHVIAHDSFANRAKLGDGCLAMGIANIRHELHALGVDHRERMSQ